MKAAMRDSLCLFVVMLALIPCWAFSGDISSVVTVKGSSDAQLLRGDESLVPDHSEREPDSQGETVHFSLKTYDGTTDIHGQIDFPTKREEPVPVVLLIPGTGLFDRHAFFGPREDVRSMLFDDLASALNERGIAAIRFDKRGVYCNPISHPKNYKTVCSKMEELKTVTPETTRDDIVLVYRHAADHPWIQSDRIAAFGHSEGSVHLSALTQEARISLSGLVFMGFVAHALHQLIHWQMVARYVAIIAERDANGDEIITNQEISAGGKILDTLPPEQIHSPSGFWTRESFSLFLEAQYQTVRADALSRDDADFCQEMASCAWWKMFFEQSPPVVSLLAEYRGFLAIHNGTKDSQTPGVKELELVRKYRLPSDPLLRLHKGMGHGLSHHPVFGPIDQPVRDWIVSDLVSAVER